MSEVINKNLRIIFMGTPEFAAIILEKMIATGFIPVAVVTAPDKPVGRKQVLTPPPVKTRIMNDEYRIKNKIQILQPEKILDSKFQILDSKPDIIVLAAYGQIIPKEILEIPKYGCLNIHPSLLPKYRGASPIQAAILNGDKETGVTIILMDEKLDHGPIVAQQQLEFSIFPPEADPPLADNFQFSNKSQFPMTKITYKELHDKLAELGAELLIKTIPKWVKGEIKAQPQDHAKATFTKIIKKENGKIDWGKSAEYIERMVRAYNPWPGAYAEIKNQKSKIKNTDKKLKIIKAEVLKIEHQKTPGMVFLTEKKDLAIACGQDALILEEVQLEGKRIMTAQAFLNGHPEIVGSILT